MDLKTLKRMVKIADPFFEIASNDCGISVREYL